jgi:hypothetical protein
MYHVRSVRHDFLTANVATLVYDNTTEGLLRRKYVRGGIKWEGLLSEREVGTMLGSGDVAYE